MKAVLIMEMPDACIDCPCHFADDRGMVACGKEGKIILANDIETFKPNWCPLREIKETLDLRGDRKCIEMKDGWKVIT